MTEQLTSPKTVVKYVAIGALTGVGAFFVTKYLESRFQQDNSGGMI